jgi:hypothetical protein
MWRPEFRTPNRLWSISRPAELGVRPLNRVNTVAVVAPDQGTHPKTVGDSYLVDSWFGMSVHNETPCI